MKVNENEQKSMKINHENSFNDEPINDWCTRKNA